MSNAHNIDLHSGRAREDAKTKEYRERNYGKAIVVTKAPENQKCYQKEIIKVTVVTSKNGKVNHYFAHSKTGFTLVRSSKANSRYVLAHYYPTQHPGSAGKDGLHRHFTFGNENSVPRRAYDGYKKVGPGQYENKFQDYPNVQTFVIVEASNEDN